MKTALEHHFEHVEERKQSKMQTLGASNPHNNNKDKHRQNAKITADTVGEIFNVGPGMYIVWRSRMAHCKHVYVSLST